MFIVRRKEFEEQWHLILITILYPRFNILRTVFNFVAVLLGSPQLDLILVMPGHDRDKVGDERGDGAFEHGRVAPNYVFIVHLALVELLHDCSCSYCGPGGQNFN